MLSLKEFDGLYGAMKVNYCCDTLGSMDIPVKNSPFRFVWQVYLI